MVSVMFPSSAEAPVLQRLGAEPVLQNLQDPCLQVGFPSSQSYPQTRPQGVPLWEVNVNPPLLCSDGDNDGIEAYYHSEFEVPVFQQTSLDEAFRILESSGEKPEELKGRMGFHNSNSLSVSNVQSGGGSAARGLHS